MDKSVTTSREGDVLYVCLNRPEKLNSFNAELVGGLQSALDDATESGVRLVAFKAAGKGFSGGFDLDKLDSLSDGDLLLRFVRVEQLLQSVFHAPVSTLALIHGACYGAAADLAVACRFRVATLDAKFRMPGSRFGVVLGASRLARLVGADTARGLLVRETAFDSTTALETGFLSAVVEPEDWPTVVENQLQAAYSMDSHTYPSISNALIEDTRDADLAELVRSVSRGSIKNRIEAYLQQVRGSKKH